ncbi:MAG: hypothetical protein ACRDRU_09325 [Pseudonocardiaceae bacterium]
MRNTITRFLAVVGFCVLGGLLTAFGGSTSTDSLAVAPAAAMVPTAPGDPPGKVSANTSSEGDIAAALTAAGVTSPKRWAAEIVEYRPYPTDDLDLAKLRENLAKYHPAAETVDKIVSALLP